VIHTDRIRAEVHRRDTTGQWQADPEQVQAGQRIRLASIGLDCQLDEVYSDTWLTNAAGGEQAG